MKKPTVEQLQQSWDEYWKVGIYYHKTFGKRFGQWFYIQYDYEVGNSYHIEQPYQAYEVLYESLSNSNGDKK